MNLYFAKEQNQTKKKSKYFLVCNPSFDCLTEWHTILGKKLLTKRPPSPVLNCCYIIPCMLPLPKSSALLDVWWCGKERKEWQDLWTQTHDHLPWANKQFPKVFSQKWAARACTRQLIAFPFKLPWQCAIKMLWAYGYPGPLYNVISVFIKPFCYPVILEYT